MPYTVLFVHIIMMLSLYKRSTGCYLMGNQRVISICTNLLVLYNTIVWCLLAVEPALLVHLQPFHLVIFVVFGILFHLVSCC